MGMVMQNWGFELLKARINPARFIPTVTQSQIYSPDAAVEAGILDQLVGAGKSIETAVALAEQLCTLPADAYAGNKLVVREQALAIMRYDLGLE